MDSPRSRTDAAHRCTSIPTDDGRGSYNLELISGNRVALRVAKLSIFFTQSEARRVLAALSLLLAVEAQSKVRL